MKQKKTQVTFFVSIIEPGTSLIRSSNYSVAERVWANQSFVSCAMPSSYG